MVGFFDRGIDDNLCSEKLCAFCEIDCSEQSRRMPIPQNNIIIILKYKDESI